MGDERQDQLMRWVERVATFCVDEWGLPPITGRILGWLMICHPPEQSAGEIADTIQASRASLTSNMRFLTAIGLVRKVRRPGDRTAYYRIEDDAWHKVVQRKLDSLSTFGDIAEEGFALAGPRGPRTERIKAAHESLTWLRDIAARHPLKHEETHATSATQPRTDSANTAAHPVRASAGQQDADPDPR